MYRHEDGLIDQKININDEKKINRPVSEQHKSFAQCMAMCVRRVYDGKIPSYAIIARDFSLHARDGKAVSSESIRKWMTGKALPQSQRLSVLINWLGQEIASSLSLNANFPKGKDFNHAFGNKKTEASLLLDSSNSDSDEYLVKLIQRLSYRDRKVMITILHTLKNDNRQQHEK
jgi:hypothetical protein